MSEEIIEGTILDRDIVKEMSESYLNYSMSVIVSRALPDVRDGLKPVIGGFFMGLQILAHLGTEDIRSVPVL